jgi:ABC-type Fe3+-hydroxamate transport system substrate-binding protein
MGAWPVLNSELVLAFDPDVIIDSAMDVTAGLNGDAEDADAGDANPWRLFTALTAVRNERVHFLDHDALYRPGPRMVEAQALLGRTLFPGLYDD